MTTQNRTKESQNRENALNVDGFDTFGVSPTSKPLYTDAPRTVFNPQLRQLQIRHFFLCNVLPLIGSVVAGCLLFWVPLTWVEITLFLGMGLLSMVGITVGYHRLFTHRAFKALPGIRASLAIMGSMAGQGPLLSWVAIHRRHHECSDKEGDPHSPVVGATRYKGNQLRGFLFAHMGWTIGHALPLPKFYCADLLKDSFMTRIGRWYFLWIGLGLLIPLSLGGVAHSSGMGALLGFLWGGPVRMFVFGQCILSVNSVCHVFGSRPFLTSDESRNNWLVAIPTLGEGWHNNHHAYPSSAYLGLRWWQIDVGAYCIDLLKHLGMAWEIKGAHGGKSQTH